MANAKKEDSKEKQLKEAAVVAETAPVKESSKVTVKTDDNPLKSTAKSGKRSAKAVKEAEEKQAKAERKTAKAETKGEEAKKPSKKPARSKLERASKKYREAAKLIEKDKVYSLKEALDLATKTSTTKFDSTVELHINLAVDPRQADQNIRGTVVLPAGTGKASRVAVLAEDEALAKKAGADLVGVEKILGELDKEQINFDVLVAAPNMMPRLAKYARLLGPRGLMPNPKSGTVTTDIAKAVSDAKAGKVEYRTDSAGIIHSHIGKVSFGKDKLQQNAEALMSGVGAARPASVKGTYIKSAYITTTMGPSIKLQNT